MKTKKKSITKAWKAIRLSLYAVTLLALTAAPLGCADEDEENSSDVSMKTGALAEPTGGKASIRKHRRPGGHSGKDDMGRRERGPKGDRRRDPVNVLFRAALDQDSLSSDQRQKIESLMAETRQGRGSRQESPRGFHTLMVKALRDGKIDADAAKAHFESMTQQREARAAARSEMLNMLYATLDAEQRQAVVADVKTRWEEKGDRFKGRHRHNDKGKNRFGKGGRHGRRGDGIFRLVKGLDLTDEQRSQIDALRADRPKRAGRMADREEMKQCRMRLLDSFAGESFDAAAVHCQKRADEDQIFGMNKHLENLSTLINILTEEQRRQLADRMDDLNS
jgi:Spy/CpxP family protein refolding chaperone